ncbi:MAG TPA: hypothetical protein VD947_01705 [Patescibacteria group bacterium]|nr:hypothetical protein [Patescibacteria group bacterium]
MNKLLTAGLIAGAFLLSACSKESRESPITPPENPQGEFIDGRYIFDDDPNDGQISGLQGLIYCRDGRVVRELPDVYESIDLKDQESCKNGSLDPSDSFQKDIFN